MPAPKPGKPTERSKSVYVSRCRQRQKRPGLRRMEVAVKAKDVALLKSIVSTLRTDGPEAEDLRHKIRPEISSPQVKTGAELYAIFRKLAPLADEVDFSKRDNISRPFFTFE